MRMLPLHASVEVTAAFAGCFFPDVPRAEATVAACDARLRRLQEAAAVVVPVHPLAAATQCLWVPALLAARGSRGHQLTGGHHTGGGAALGSPFVAACSMLARAMQYRFAKAFEFAVVTADLVPRPLPLGEGQALLPPDAALPATARRTQTAHATPAAAIAAANAPPARSGGATQDRGFLLALAAAKAAAPAAVADGVTGIEDGQDEAVPGPKFGQLTLSNLDADVLSRTAAPTTPTAPAGGATVLANPALGVTLDMTDGRVIRSPGYHTAASSRNTGARLLQGPLLHRCGGVGLAPILALVPTQDAEAWAALARLPAPSTEAVQRRLAMLRAEPQTQPRQPATPAGGGVPFPNLNVLFPVLLFDSATGELRLLPHIPPLAPKLGNQRAGEQRGDVVEEGKSAGEPEAETRFENLCGTLRVAPPQFAQTSLPLCVDPFLLACALRLVYIDRVDPTFSLDPWAFSEDAGFVRQAAGGAAGVPHLLRPRRAAAVNPGGPVQAKVYNPDWLHGTAFGEIMFLADYELKLYALGKKTPPLVTVGGSALATRPASAAADEHMRGKRASTSAAASPAIGIYPGAGSAVAVESWRNIMDFGSETYFDDQAQGRGTQRPSYARLWFSLSKLHAALGNSTQAIGGGLSAGSAGPAASSLLDILHMPRDGVRLRVDAREMAEDPNSPRGLSDAAVMDPKSPASLFAQQINSRIDDFLSWEPIFARLVDAAKALALAKALFLLGVPISTDAVMAFSAPLACTALRVPTVTNAKSWETVEEKGTRRISTKYNYTIFGGVSFAGQLTWGTPTGAASSGAGSGVAKQRGAAAPARPSSARGGRFDAAASDRQVAHHVPSAPGSVGSFDDLMVVSQSLRNSSHGSLADTPPSTPRPHSARPASARPASARAASTSASQRPGSARPSQGRTENAPEASSKVGVTRLLQPPVNWAIEQRNALLRSQRHPPSSASGSAAAASGIMVASADLTASSSPKDARLESGATPKPDPTAFALPFAVPQSASCASCQQRLLWTTSLREAGGLIFCSSPACLDARKQKNPADAVAADGRPSTPSAASSTTASSAPSASGGRAQGATRTRPGSAFSKSTLPGKATNPAGTGQGTHRPTLVHPSIGTHEHTITQLACGGCGHAIEPSEKYLCLPSEFGETVFHLNDVCMRCQSDGDVCHEPAFNEGASARLTAATVVMTGRIINGLLVCAKHAARAEGMDAPCPGCTGPLYLPPKGVDASTAAALLAAVPGAVLTLPDGRRFHAGCFRCNRCKRSIPNTFVVVSNNGIREEMCCGCASESQKKSTPDAHTQRTPAAALPTGVLDDAFEDRRGEDIVPDAAGRGAESASPSAPLQQSIGPTGASLRRPVDDIGTTVFGHSIRAQHRPMSASRTSMMPHSETATTLLRSPRPGSAPIRVTSPVPVPTDVQKTSRILHSADNGVLSSSLPVRTEVAKAGMSPLTVRRTESRAGEASTPGRSYAVVPANGKPLPLPVVTMASLPSLPTLPAMHGTVSAPVAAFPGRPFLRSGRQREEDLLLGHRSRHSAASGMLSSPFESATAIAPSSLIASPTAKPVLGVAGFRPKRY
jgi:hypothetical protein